MRALIVLLLLSAAGYWYHYRSVRYEELTSLRGEIQNTERQLSEKIVLRDKLNERLEPLRKARDAAGTPGTADPAKEIEILKESLTEATAKLDAAEADYAAAVETVREAAKKESFPVIKLPSGEELKDCTISKFGEGFLTLSHAQGIKRIQSEDLPSGWAERYALDYISRESQAEKDALNTRIEEATVSPVDLKKAQLGEVEAQLEKVTAQLLAMSTQMRESRRKADQLVREAYRIALDKGAKGNAAAAQRTAKFNESRKVDAGREQVQKKYKALRDQKLALEEKRNELKRRPAPTTPAP